MSEKKLNARWVLPAVLAVGLSTPVLAADDSGGHKPKASSPARMEKVEGSDLPRVIVTEKAAQRLDIQTEPVREERLRRWLTVGGDVESLPKSARAADAAGAEAVPPLRVRVPMVAGWMAQSQPVRVIQDDDDDDDNSDDLNDDEDGQIVFVLPQHTNKDLLQKISVKRYETASGDKAVAEAAAVDRNLYYVVEGAQQVLKAGQRLVVRVTDPNSGGLHRVIPYSAVIFDAKGETWTYVNPEPLVFVRERIVIDHIQGDLAVLKDGPKIGTNVVKVGAAELYGVENKVGH
jgi:hypothetical protein